MMKDPLAKAPCRGGTRSYFVLNSVDDQQALPTAWDNGHLCFTAKQNPRMPLHNHRNMAVILPH